MVLLEGIELSTSPLPRENSTEAAGNYVVGIVGVSFV
jgi:hypothetical protein